jgi:hypothetical protein
MKNIISAAFLAVWLVYLAIYFVISVVGDAMSPTSWTVAGIFWIYIDIALCVALTCWLLSRPLGRRWVWLVPLSLAGGKWVFGLWIFATQLGTFNWFIATLMLGSVLLHLPILYGVYSYALRSPHIWRKSASASAPARSSAATKA